MMSFFFFSSIASSSFWMSAVVTLKDAMLLIVACFSSRERSVRRRRRRRRRRKKRWENKRNKKERWERYIFLFFFTFIDLRVENIFLIESSCRKETTPTRVGCRVVIVKMWEGRDAVVMVRVGGKGCYMKRKKRTVFLSVCKSWMIRFDGRAEPSAIQWKTPALEEGYGRPKRESKKTTFSQLCNGRKDSSLKKCGHVPF